MSIFSRFIDISPEPVAAIDITPGPRGIRQVTDFDPKKPYNELPALPPPRDAIETTDILKRCITARVALAELKQAAELIPNSAVLVNALPLLEARASSEIENIVTTTDKLFEFADIAEDRADAATKEALRYRTALYEGTKMVQRRMLTTDMAIQICSTIKGMDLDIRAESGTTLKSRMTGEVIYTPPVGQQLLLEKLDNWARFMQEETDIDPLVRMAIQHYQFEAIHPFVDGNGRTGRILNILFLVEHGLLDSPILYLSRYIIQNKAAYYRLLQKVTLEQDWRSWIMFFLDGVEETCTWTTDKIKSIRELMDHTAEYVHERLPNIYSWELKQLCDIGVLQELKSGREAIFVHPKYIELLNGEENVWVYYAGVDTDSENAEYV